MAVDQVPNRPPKTFLALVAGFLPVTCTVVSCVALAASWHSLPVVVFLLVAVSTGGALTYWCWLRRAQHVVSGRSKRRVSVGLGGGAVLMLVSSVWLMEALFGASTGGSGDMAQAEIDKSSASGVGASGSANTFSRMWSPALAVHSVTTDRGSRVVTGVEIEAVGCPSANKEFIWSNLQKGDEVDFDVRSVASGGAEGAYRIEIEGAGIEEVVFIEGEHPEHVQVVAEQDGSVAVGINALRRSTKECRDSREFVAVENGKLN